MLIAQLVMTRTVLGKAIYAVGGNEQTARYSGLRQAVLGAVIVIAVYLNVGLGGTRGGERIHHKGV